MNKPEHNAMELIPAGPCQAMLSHAHPEPVYPRHHRTPAASGAKRLACLWLGFLLCWAPALFGQGTAFTYQGLLVHGGLPATGTFDLSFTLYNSVSDGIPLAGPLTNSSTAVSNGLFTVTLDFGSTAFSSQSCWIEIGVRPRSGQDFAVLTPRQSLSSVPFAIIASDVAAGNIPRLDVESGNYFSGPNVFTNVGNLFVGSFYGDGSGLTNLAWSAPLTLTNAGNLFVGSFGGDGSALTNLTWVPPACYSMQPNEWGDNPTNGLVWCENNDPVHSPLAHVVMYRDWGAPSNWRGEPTTQTLLISCRNIRLEPGWYTPSGSSYLSIGNEDIYGDVYINCTHPWQYDPGPNQTGVSIPLGFYCYGYDSATNRYDCYPGIQGHAVPVNQIGVDAPLMGLSGNQYTWGELWFYSKAPTSPGVSTGTNYDYLPSVYTGRMRTNGWELRGRWVQERATAAVADQPGVALDFAKGACFDLTPSVTNLTLFTTNRDGAATNYERRVFLVHAGHQPHTVAYPVGWNTQVGQPLPPGVGAAQMLRLELESTGAGETNVNVIAAGVFVDHTVALAPMMNGLSGHTGTAQPATQLASQPQVAGSIRSP